MGLLMVFYMIFFAVVSLIVGGIGGIVFYCLENHKKQKTFFANFSENSTYGKVPNADVAVDEIINDFKLLD